MRLLKTNIHKGCSSDSMRAPFCCVHFRNGYIYASNTILMIREDLKHIHKFEDEWIKALEGKAIWAKSIPLLQNYFKIKIEEDGILVHRSKENDVIKVFFSNEPPPNFEGVLKPAIKNFNECAHKTSSIRFSPTSVKKVFDCIGEWVPISIHQSEEKSKPAVILFGEELPSYRVAVIMLFD